jgi:hypothetical protein
VGISAFYIFSFWRIFVRNRGNRVIECGSITLAIFFIVLALWRIPDLAESVAPSLMLLVFLLCLLTIFFLLQQGYHALRRRKSGS